MKRLSYIFLLAACTTLIGCMNDNWSTPENTNVFGNNDLKETNVVTINTLLTTYRDALNAPKDSYKKIETDIQIKGRVTGNDIQGNLYNCVAISDGTGAILIDIAQGGLFSYLPVGQEILVSLKDLYIGSYGKQAQIGTLYTNARGVTTVSRMNRFLWNEHFKSIGTPDASQVTPEVFDLSRVADADYLESHSGRLMVLKEVKFKGADGTKVYASDKEKDAANNVNRELEDFDSRQIVVRTSTYADFAAMPLPQTKVNITGIFTRYRDTWQILIRTENDVQEVN